LSKEGKGLKKSHQQFIEEVNLKFNGAIIVKDLYKGSNIDIGFICTKHGEFYSKPHVLLQSKYGCYDCFREGHKGINSKGIRYCCVCGSNEKVQEYNKTAKDYCKKHYNQMRKYGEVRDKTIFDKNEIIKYENFAEVVLVNKKLEKVGRVVISLDKVEKIINYKWYVMSNGYAATRTYGKHMLLHRFLLNAKEDEKVDHINRIRTDCRNENLRKCNSSENAMNSSKSRRNTSGTTGVWYNKRDDNWVAEIFVNGKKHILGRSKNKDDAIRLRLNAEIKYFGKFAPIRGELNE
jgi:Holliday junction resolvase